MLLEKWCAVPGSNLSCSPSLVQSADVWTQSLYDAEGTSLHETSNSIPVATSGLEEGLADQLSILFPACLQALVKSLFKLFLLFHSYGRGIPTFQSGKVKGKYKTLVQGY